MRKRLFLSSIILAFCTSLMAQTEMDRYIDQLMQKMTLQGKNRSAESSARK